MKPAVIQQRIAACEEAYLDIFCSKGREWGLYVYQDRQLPDSRRHNFIRIPEHIPQMQYKSLADVARNTARATGRRFLQLQMPTEIEFKRAQMATVGFYAQTEPTPATAAASATAAADFQLRKFSADDTDLLTAFMLAQSAEGLDEDFCRRLAARKIGAYEDTAGLECWLACSGDELLAAAELFMAEGCAKIDLQVDKSLSADTLTALLAVLGDMSHKQGAEIVYLSLDTADPLTGCAEALGFSQCGEYYTVLWQFD